jgi:hypothetical protein
MIRQLPDYLTTYIKFTEKTEPPTNYHIWTCLSVIAAAMQRKCYLRWGFKTLYPNLYVVLIGPSGCRKGTAMNIGKDLLLSIAGVNLSSESVTREALIRDMHDGISTYTDPTDGTVISHSSVTVISEELSVFLGQQNVKFLADLTDWFDCSDQWTYRTKGSGTDKLVGVCVNILGATAPDWLRSILPQEAFGGGFTSRVIFVVEEQKKQIVPDPRIPPEILALRPALLLDLEQITAMSGEMIFEDEAMELYTAWYTKQSKTPAIKDPHFAGYCERRAIHVLKLSMVMSASRSCDRRITKADFSRALALLESVEPKMPRAFLGLGRAKYSDMTAQIYEYVKKHKKASMAELLNKFDVDLDEYTLSLIAKTLAARKVVKIEYNSDRGEYYYSYIQGEGE